MAIELEAKLERVYEEQINGQTVLVRRFSTPKLVGVDKKLQKSLDKLDKVPLKLESILDWSERHEFTYLSKLEGNDARG